LAVRNLSAAASIAASVAYDSRSHATAAGYFGTFGEELFHIAMTPSLASPVRRYGKMIAATPSETWLRSIASFTVDKKSSTFKGISPPKE
jgi:hypothetical protein